MKVEKLILGTVQFGLTYGINNVQGKPREHEVVEILDLARSKGIKTLDTADAYGNATELLGDYMKHHTAGTFKINTKFKGTTSAGAIRQQLERSLLQLNVDTIKVYFYHSYQEFVELPEVMNELVQLRNSGVIKQIGVSVYSNEEFAIATDHPEVNVIQIPFNALDNLSQRGELMHKARLQGKVIQVRSVFLQGLFFKELSAYPSQLEPLKRYIQELHSTVKRSGRTMEDIALSYALNQPDIDQVIIGVDTKQQLMKNVGFAEATLPEDIREAIDAIQVKEVELLYPKNWK
jgi:uncharacterized protein